LITYRKQETDMKYIEQRELKKTIVEFKWTEFGAKIGYNISDLPPNYAW
jgi:hypothetical protein